MKYLMQSQRSCGLDALTAALDNAGFPRRREEIQDLMGWRETGDIRADILDNPTAHKAVLDKVCPGMWRWVDAEQILRGECAVNKTVVLLHGKDDPKTLLPEDWLNQHWAILAWWETVKTGQQFRDGYVQFEWGDGTTRNFSRENFLKAFNGGGEWVKIKHGGGVKSAYEIGVDGRTKIARGYAWFGKIVRKIFGR